MEEARRIREESKLKEIEEDNKPITGTDLMY
jgi:hypothetical protein